MSSIFDSSLIVPAEVVGAIVAVTWLVCLAHLARFCSQRSAAAASGTGGHRGQSFGTSYNTAMDQTAISSMNTMLSSKDRTSLKTTDYSNTAYGMTTMLQGQTTIVSSTELSIPGFLLVKKDADYIVGKEIARGGGGVIYAAITKSPPLLERSQGNEIVAKGFGDALDTMEEEYRNAFYQELSLMWRFRSNNGFVRVYGYSETPAMILMKFYHMGSMADFVHGQGTVSQSYSYTVSTVSLLFLELCRALSVMHSAGYVHCDLKPGNVLLDVDAGGQLQANLSDFGICQIVDPNVLRVKAFRVSQAIGASLSYAAPETLVFLQSGSAFNADETIKKADVYALSCVLYEMLTRRVPWAPV